MVPARKPIADFIIKVYNGPKQKGGRKLNFCPL
jgi:hypothetical protein